MPASSPRPVLVTAATGKTGSRVAARLAVAGLTVRAGSRRATPAFDWQAPESWGAALAGCGAAYLAYHPDLAVPGADRAIAAFAGEALAQGVRRLVLLSGRGEPGAEAAERALAASGADWTVLRASWFQQNFSESLLLPAVLAGEVALPVGPVPEPFIDADDIAEAAVAALTDPRHAGRLYELTGPQALTFAEAVAEIAAATGRPLAFRRVSPAEFDEGLAAAGLPAETRALIGELFATVLDGRNSALAHGLEQLLGRPGRSLRDYARRTAASGIWTPRP